MKASTDLLSRQWILFRVKNLRSKLPLLEMIPSLISAMFHLESLE